MASTEEKQHMMRIGSLFSGLGGLELGLEMALDCRIVWQVENNPYCNAVLASNWPEAQRYGDIHTVDGGALPAVDLICGGFPCQDISCAGTREGLDGKRSGLWFQFLRVLTEARAAGRQPRFVVVENVGRLVTSGLDTVVAGLAALGYQVAATRMRASDVGAPHRRERCFLVGWRLADAQRDRLQGELAPGSAAATAARRGDVATPDSGGSEGERESLDRWPLLAYIKSARGGQPHGGIREAGPPAEPARPGGADGGARDSAGRDDRGQARAQPRLGRAADGLPHGVDGPGPYGRWPAGRGQPQEAWEAPRIAPRVPSITRWATAALGNAVVPQCSYQVGLLIAHILQQEAS